MADENGNGSRTIAFRVGEIFNARLRMKHAIPALGLASLLGGGYAYKVAHPEGFVATVDAHWIAKVDKHLDVDFPAGFQRLGNVETDVRETRTQIRELRRDFLELALWQAGQVQDHQRIDAIGRRMRELERER